MSHKIVQHKNFESDTVHGHTIHMAERIVPPVLDKENQSHCDNANILCDDYDRREMQREKDNIVKKVEYREYLLKQMQDKKKENLEDMPLLKTFSEESLNANEKMNLKLQKQKENKQDLDDCVKMKHDLKLKSQRTEFEEELKRSEFWKKHDDETIHTLERAKQKIERKEHSRNEVALMWIEEKRKDSRREKFINSLIEKDNITDLNEYQKELLELEKSIRLKKELFKENDEKISEWMKNLELLGNHQEELKKDIEQEEELEKRLKLKSEALQNTMDEVDKSKKILQERNYQCANNRFFGIE